MVQVIYIATGHANPMMKPKTVFHFPDTISMVHTVATVYTAIADTPVSCDYCDLSLVCLIYSGTYPQKTIQQ